MKKRTVTIVLTAIIILSLLCAGAAFYWLTSPEYALAETFSDIKSNGISGLEAHLSDNALEIVEGIVKWSDNLDENAFTSAAKVMLIDLIATEASKIEWSIEDILRGSKKSDAVIGFNYDDKYAGSVDVFLIYENKEWKINEFGNIKIDKIE